MYYNSARLLTFVCMTSSVVPRATARRIYIFHDWVDIGFSLFAAF